MSVSPGLFLCKERLLCSASRRVTRCFGCMLDGDRVLSTKLSLLWDMQKPVIRSEKMPCSVVLSPHHVAARCADVLEETASSKNVLLGSSLVTRSSLTKQVLLATLFKRGQGLDFIKEEKQTSHS